MSKVEVCLEVEALLLLLGAGLLETELVRVRVGCWGDLHKKIGQNVHQRFHHDILPPCPPPQYQSSAL